MSEKTEGNHYRYTKKSQSMNLTDKQMDVLDRFLRNEMTAADETMWKSMMQDPGVQDEVRNMTHLQQMIQQEGRDRLRAELKTWDEAQSQTKVIGKRRFIDWRWASAAAVALILVSIFVLRGFQDDSKDLFASYFEPYPNIVAPIQKGEAQTTPYEQAFQLYEAGAYQDAIDVFETLPANDSNVLFYTAVAALKLGDQEVARLKLDALDMIKGHKYRDAAVWYRALLEIQSGNDLLAIALIEDVVTNTRNPFHQKAIKLIKEMDH